MMCLISRCFIISSRPHGPHGMKNTLAKEISVNHPLAKTVVPPYMADQVLKPSPVPPPPATVLLEDLGVYLGLYNLRVVRCYWTARKEFIVEVAEVINADSLLRLEEQRQAGDALQATVPGVGAGRDEQRAH